MNAIDSWFDTAVAFLFVHSPQLILILLIAVVGRLCLFLLVKHIIKGVRHDDGKRVSGREKRARSLADLLTTTGNVVIALAVIIMALRVVGVDPLPILAGASVLGFGIGFGAQTLIKDLFAGIFIFVENQFAVGDRVTIGLSGGTVYKMSMRTTVLYDDEGNLIFIPNGTITTVVNHSLSATRKSRFDGRDEPSSHA